MSTTVNVLFEKIVLNRRRYFKNETMENDVGDGESGGEEEHLRICNGRTTNCIDYTWTRKRLARCVCQRKPEKSYVVKTKLGKLKNC